jgi:hypothetical protein
MILSVDLILLLGRADLLDIVRPPSAGELLIPIQVPAMSQIGQKPGHPWITSFTGYMNAMKFSERNHNQ